VVHCHHTDREQNREAGLANPGSSLRWARGGGRLLSDGARDVRQPPPQAPVVELVEVEAAVERGCLIVDRVDDQGSRSELAAAARLALATEQRPPESAPPERGVDRVPSARVRPRRRGEGGVRRSAPARFI